MGDNKLSNGISGVVENNIYKTIAAMPNNKIFNELPGVVSNNLSNIFSGIAKNNPTKIVLEGFRTDFNTTAYLKSINRPFIDVRISVLQGTIAEQEKAYEKNISKGYAYSTYYHLITRVIHRHEDKNYVDALIETKLFDFVLNKLQKVESSDYVKEVFESINKENLTHNIPFFTLLIERLMRILVDKLDDKVELWKLKKIIKSSFETYKVVDKRINTIDSIFYEEKEQINILERERDENAKSLYEDTFTHIIEGDFMQNEENLEGKILNRHVLLHGKQDFDKLNEDEAMKLVYLILFFLDLIELKNDGTLVFE